jgi:hypothetical protein
MVQENRKRVELNGENQFLVFFHEEQRHIRN